MIQAKCIQKFRNKSNQIIGYRLQDNQGSIRDVTTQQLKTAIHNNQINIINLTLTSDNRLIDTTLQSKQQAKQQPKNKTVISQQQLSLLTRKIVEQINKPKALKFQSNQNLEAIASKAPMLGYTTTKLSNNFLLLENNTELILVSNKQIQLDNTKIDENQNWIGLFQKTNFTSIDFHNTDTSNVTNMGTMFRECKAQTLDLSSFDTSNVTDMSYMFYDCQLQNLDLSSFDTSNVTDMNHMFYHCAAKTLDLSSFNTSNVTNMKWMFFSYFNYYNCQTLDLSSFDTSNVTSMGWMFADCQVKTIDLSSFNTSSVTSMGQIFDGCRAQIKTMDTKLLNELNCR